MGTQSCVVVVAMLVVILAVIINITAFGAPRWVTGKTENGTELYITTKGLWQVCVNGECDMIVWSDQKAWFRAVQAMFSIGTALAIITLVVFCSIFATNLSTERMYLVIWFVMITNVVSSLCLCISLGIFGVNAQENPGDTDVDRQLDWSYYVAIWGAIFSLASTILLVWEGCMAANWFKIRPYYDL